MTLRSTDRAQSGVLGTQPPVARQTVAVRLEGGVGDHILGMRLLRFIHEKYPESDIVVYSDAAGNPTQLEVASMSPLVARVIPIYRRKCPAPDTPATSLELIRPQDRELIETATVFVDGHGDLMYIDAVALLNVPLFEILSQPPELKVPLAEVVAANKLLAKYAGAVFVGLNLTKWGAGFIQQNRNLITHICHQLLSHREVIILNIFRSDFEYAHWPEPSRTIRQEVSISDASAAWNVCALSDRIIPCVNLPIGVVTAILRQCRYFIGVDNGVKHLAWALELPRTFIHPERPSPRHVVRWMPDLHRMLKADSPKCRIDQHIDEATRYLFRGGTDMSVRHSSR